MTQLHRLLSLLADGEFHSGTELAATLGISRAAVWKQLQRLGELQLTLHAVRGRGYRIPGGLDLLDREQVRAAFPVAVLPLLRELDVFDVVDSTNQVAASRTRAGGGHGYVCLAEYQTAGRGRRGRSWIAPYGGNICLTAAWEFRGGIAALEGLSLAVGVAVAEALASLGVGDIGLKWPNDLVVGQRKLGGILIEVGGEVGGNCQVICGVGINVAVAEEGGAAIDQPWIDLRSLGVVPDRNVLAGRVAAALLQVFAVFADNGLAPFRARWAARDALLGQAVDVIAGDGKRTGIAEGVDTHGALLLREAAGVVAIRGGEVSVRRSAP